MILTEQHKSDKAVSTSVLLKGAEGGMTISLQILKGEQLKEHITKVPAVLICIQGEVVFSNEQGIKETLLSGEFIQIEAMVKHWVDGVSDSQLILVK